MLAPSLLKEARLRARMSQEGLGERTGLSKSEISRYETGKVALSLERLAELVAGAGLELDIALRPVDRSQDPLMRGNVARSAEQRLRGLRRRLERTAEIQGGTEPFDPERILVALADANVDYIVIGGVASVLWGSPFDTTSLDLTVREGKRNHARLQRAREHLGGAREGEEDLEVYRTDAGEIRIVATPISLPRYQTLRRRSTPMVVDGRTILVAPLADVIRSAEARPRPDRRAELGALRRLATELAPA